MLYSNPCASTRAVSSRATSAPLRPSLLSMLYHARSAPHLELGAAGGLDGIHVVLSSLDVLVHLHT